MKKTLFFLFNLLVVSKLAISQSVSLAPTIPASPTAGTVVYNNSTNQLQYWNGTAWISITNAAAGTGWALNGNDIYSNNTGNVGIGISTPKAPFNVADGKTVLFGSDSSGSGNKLIWYPSKGAFRVGNPFGNIWDYTNVGYNSIALGKQTTASGTYSTAMGLNTTASGYSSTALGNQTTASGYHSTAMGFNTTASWFYSTAMGASTTASGNISTAMGGNTTASGDYSTAIGNGTTASGYSSTAMGVYNVNVPNSLFMLGNGTGNAHSNALTVMMDGKVGIGTTAPLAPLHVAGNNILSSGSSAAYWFGAIYNTGTTINSITNGSWAVGLLVDYDIVGKGSIVSAQTVTTSDARIKNIIGISNNQQDLETLKKIQITDYRFKDVANWGNQTFKKVIAQQVEEVYPQAVRKMTSTIPDIYSLAEKVVFDETNKTLTCSLSKCYDIKIGEKIEFIHKKEGKIKAEVVAVSGNSFTVKDWQYPTDKIFVYGREVNDFRTVDYEAISMLGISAIQQLAKENEELKSSISALKTKLSEIDELKAEMASLKSLFLKNEIQKQIVNKKFYPFTKIN